MKITIKEIAKIANVSVATVSRVINNSGYTHVKTKEIVEKVIKEYGYEPNQIAKILIQGQSGFLGVIIPHVNTPFYGELVEGIEVRARQYGLKTMLCITEDNQSKELDFIKVFESYKVDGIIVCSNFQNVQKLLDLHIPIISVDHVLDPNIPSITTDNIEGGKIAAKKLIELGCKNIVLFRGPSFLLTVEERTQGFVSVLKKHSIPFTFYDFDLVNPDREFIMTILENNPEIDGVFTTSDTLGIITSGCATKLGRKINEDLHLISFDGLAISNWIYPPLMTVEQPIKYMGACAVSTIHQILKNEPLAENHTVLSVKLKS